MEQDQFLELKISCAFEVEFISTCIKVRGSFSLKYSRTHSEKSVTYQTNSCAWQNDYENKNRKASSS